MFLKWQLLLLRLHYLYLHSFTPCWSVHLLYCCFYCRPSLGPELSFSSILTKTGLKTPYQESPRPSAADKDYWAIQPVHWEAAVFSSSLACRGPLLAYPARLRNAHVIHYVNSFTSRNIGLYTSLVKEKENPLPLPHQKQGQKDRFRCRLSHISEYGTQAGNNKKTKVDNFFKNSN